MADEIVPYLLGPMPAQKFLDDFFPVNDIPDLASVPPFRPGCYGDTVKANKELLMYHPFVSPLYSFFYFPNTCCLFSRSVRLSSSPPAFRLLTHIASMIAILGQKSRSESNRISLFIILTHQSLLRPTQASLKSLSNSSGTLLMIRFVMTAPMPSLYSVTQREPGTP